MNARAFLAGLAAMLLLAGSARAQAASFDCAKARTPDERAVCDDPRLSGLDDLMPASVAQARRTTAGADVTQTARDFLADRRACGSDHACILSTYLDVLRSFRDLGATVATPPGITALTIAGADVRPARTLPARIGQCTSTEVDSVTPRLGGDGPPAPADFDSGTAVDFTNGGHQVSYEREPALLTSKRHDRVVMCLVSLPHHCPPNDDRGRFYIVTNQRTGQTWMLPDAQHSCGGA